MSGTPLLLHACCGPCSLEPLRVLREQGFLPTIVYVNPNIQPHDEYVRRLETLRAWAVGENVEVVEGPYEAERWEREVARYGTNRLARCQACYRLRLEGAATLAAELGCAHMSTTLAVSPYQLFDACGTELGRICARAGLTAVWQDFRPLYPQATTADAVFLPPRLPLSAVRHGKCARCSATSDVHARRFSTCACFCPCRQGDER